MQYLWSNCILVHLLCFITMKLALCSCSHSGLCRQLSKAYCKTLSTLTISLDSYTAGNIIRLQLSVKTVMGVWESQGLQLTHHSNLVSITSHSLFLNWAVRCLHSKPYNLLSHKTSRYYIAAGAKWRKLDTSMMRTFLHADTWLFYKRLPMEIGSGEDRDWPTCN